jgi:hypothetical protein
MATLRNAICTYLFILEVSFARFFNDAVITQCHWLTDQYEHGIVMK